MKIRARGFSLIELMVVVVIIGILAAIAMPEYSDYVLKGKLAESTTLLTDLQTRQEQYYQDNRSYLDITAAATTRPVSGTYYTRDCVTANTGQTYICTTDGTAQGLGKFTVTEAGVKATVTPPTGWTAPATGCWVRNKGGGC